MAEEGKRISPKLSATKDAPNAHTKIGRIIAVVSGKGGVGKSTVSSMLACALQRQGKRVGIMDADVTGPSIPKAFGLNSRLYGDAEGNIVPPLSVNGIPVVSTNLMLDNPAQAVAWRGPVVSGVLKQFFGETNWGELDYLVVDMPPGTSDVALTVFQSLPVDGIIVVTSPQDLVEMIVDKAIDLANGMHVPVLGIAMDLCSGGASSYAMSYAFAGLLSGVFSRHSRLVFTLSFVLSSALALLCAWNERVGTSALFETFAASVIFFLLPGRFLGSIGMLLHAGERGGGERDLRRFVAAKLRALGEAYGELYGIVERSLSETGNDEDIARIFDRAADRVCVRCVNKNRCWNAEYIDTLSALNDATAAMREKGSLTEADVPGYFRARCSELGAFVSAVNSELRALNYRRELRTRLAENRSVAWEQYADMAQLLGAAADELGSVNGSDVLAEQRLGRYLHSLEIDAEVSVYRDGRGRLRATMESGSLAPLLGQPRWLETLSEILGVRVCLPQGAESSDARLTVLEAEPLAVSVGIAALKKRGEKVSGDRGSYFKTDAGVLCVILSDGMGSGDEAARDSAEVVAILEKFLRAGADGAAAMKLLNSALLLRGGENWGFATVDLMCVDLFSGETSFYKYGAAPSYVCSGRNVRQIRGETLAAGLSLGGGSAPDVVRMKLSPGSTAIIASDGVIRSGEDDWVRNMLLRGASDMKQLAKSALREAERLYGGSDDMTVVTVRVEERA